MKFRIFVLIILSLYIISCKEDEFLNEVPVSVLSTKSFFETSEQFEQAVNAAYTNLQRISDNTGAFWIFGELRSDNTTFQDNDVDRSGHVFWYVDMFTMSASTGATDLQLIAWRNLYEGIGKCNIVIQNSDKEDLKNKNRYVAEVKFLRALYYFNLVRWFGEVPLVTKAATSYNEAFEGNKRVSTDLIYEQIIADLNEAKQNLPKSYSANDWGRTTEGAARTLLAKVLMWQEKYGEAATELEAVMSSQQYSLLKDYSAVFDINNENNSEIIFSIQFIEGPFGLGNSNMYTFTPWNSGNRYLPHAQNVNLAGMNIPTEDLMNSFEQGDLRKAMIDTSWIDTSFGTYHDSIVPFTKKFWDPIHAERLITGNDFPVFRYPHVLLMLAECYLREGGGDPVPLVNQVRQRARLDPLPSITLDDIIHERRVEFHCEADRWDVLVRTGKAAEIMTIHGQQERTSRPEVIRGQAYNMIKILFPIPTSVLENDPSMEQNSEYK